MPDTLFFESLDDILVIPPLKLLAAEDSSTNRLFLKQFLDNSNLELHFAENGSQAVQAFQDIKPDMVLMDINMPEMGGIEATTSIRSYEWLHALERCPIIALTTNSDVMNREVCLAADMDDFLTKPIDKKALWETIARWAPLQKTDGFVFKSTSSNHNQAPQITTNPQKSAIDESRVKKMKKDFQGRVFASLVKQYCTDAEQALKGLEKAVATNDIPEAARVLHLLQGCSANFGASTLAELCVANKTQLQKTDDAITCDIPELRQAYLDAKDRLVAIMIA